MSCFVHASIFKWARNVKINEQKWNCGGWHCRAPRPRPSLRQQLSATWSRQLHPGHLGPLVRSTVASHGRGTATCASCQLARSNQAPPGSHPASITATSKGVLHIAARRDRSRWGVQRWTSLQHVQLGSTHVVTSWRHPPQSFACGWLLHCLRLFFTFAVVDVVGSTLLVFVFNVGFINRLAAWRTSFSARFVFLSLPLRSVILAVPLKCFQCGVVDWTNSTFLIGISKEEAETTFFSLGTLFAKDKF